MSLVASVYGRRMNKAIQLGGHQTACSVGHSVSGLKSALWLAMDVGTCWQTIIWCSVADPHHIDADPDPTFHFDVDPDPACHFGADPDPAFHFDADPDPAFHFDADPDPDPNFHFDADPDPAPSFQKSSALKKCSNRLTFHTFCLVICKLIRIRIQLITLMRIRIHNTVLMLTES